MGNASSVPSHPPFFNFDLLNSLYFLYSSCLSHLLIACPLRVTTGVPTTHACPSNTFQLSALHSVSFHITTSKFNLITHFLHFQSLTYYLELSIPPTLSSFLFIFLAPLPLLHSVFFLNTKIPTPVQHSAFFLLSASSLLPPTPQAFLVLFTLPTHILHAHNITFIPCMH